MDWLELKLPPVAQAVVHAVAIWAVSVWSPLRPMRLPGNDLIAGALLATGMAMAAIAVVHFRSARTTVDPRTPGSVSAVVSTGVYRWSRNPMYLGILLCLTAWAVYLAQPLGGLFLPVFIGYMNRFQILPEERALREKFGAEFTAYARRVRRWL